MLDGEKNKQLTSMILAIAKVGRAGSDFSAGIDLKGIKKVLKHNEDFA